MFPQNISNVNNSYGYGQLTPYGTSAPYSVAKGSKAGGKTLLIVVGIIGAGILAGMALGLGLGIGAAGIITDTNLINVTNTTTYS